MEDDKGDKRMITRQKQNLKTYITNMLLLCTSQNKNNLLQFGVIFAP